MTKRKAALTKQQKLRQREKRRYPFREETRIIELLQSNCYGDFKTLIQQIRPYLLDTDVNYLTVNSLFFDLKKIVGLRTYLYEELKLFFKKVKEKDGLRCKQSHFFRYLSDPEHCNLGLTEQSMKAIMNQ